MSTRHPLTERRKATFLRVLRETGSPIAAASAATPWSTHDQCGVATFRDEARRDPAFAAGWERAKQDALAAIEKEIVRRAMNPPQKPIWAQGELKGWIEDRNSSDKMLLRLAARLDPGWREHTNVDANVIVQGVMLTISPEDVLLLPPDERGALLELIGKIADAKGEDSELPALPPGDATVPTT